MKRETMLTKNELNTAWAAWERQKGANPHDMRVVLEQAKEAVALLLRCEAAERWAKAERKLTHYPPDNPHYEEISSNADKARSAWLAAGGVE